MEFTLAGALLVAEVFVIFYSDVTIITNKALYFISTNTLKSLGRSPYQDKQGGQGLWCKKFIHDRSALLRNVSLWKQRPEETLRYQTHKSGIISYT